jgi:glucose/mannose-6-phosphate isomerase
MNLDDLAAFQANDPANMLAHIEGLPGQLEAAWALGWQLPLPDLSGISQVVMAGVGGSTTGGALIAALTAGECRLPFSICRDYDLPAWAAGPGTLVIAASHTGRHEEALSALQGAAGRGVRLLALTTGGPLAERTRQAGGAVWDYVFAGPPRAAIAYTFALPLALFIRAGWLADRRPEFTEALAALREQQKSLRAASPVSRNPAKRMAGQFMDRYVLVFGSGFMGAVARRWQTQVNENAKGWAQSESLPEMDYDAVVGLGHPEALVTKYMAVFLESDFDHPRNQMRSRFTRELFMTSGFNTDVIRGAGPTALAQLLTSLHYGDYVSYYLAMAYGVDPSPVEPIDFIRERMAGG